MNERTYTAFVGHERLVTGDLGTLLRRLKAAADGGAERLLIFEDLTGRQVDFDLRGSIDEVLARASPAEPRPGPGRPKLGVVSREISLLPRHWEWLEAQPQGISATLRRLVDEARGRAPNRERARQLRDAAGSFLWAVAGDFPGFEEATRALYRGEIKRLEELTASWPGDVREYALGRVREAAKLQEPGEDTRAG